MTLASCNGTVLQSGIGDAFVDGNVLIIGALCLEAGLNGLLVEVDGGTYPDDVSWSITFPSGVVETGVAGSQEIGACPAPSPAPSVSAMPTVACELYTIELYDSYGDG